jgi:ABC-type transporter Mla maintaining outer membrane lipid asymmetry ATPase subunit MlaF
MLPYVQLNVSHAWISTLLGTSGDGRTTILESSI